MQQLHPDPLQLLIFILNSSQLFAALYMSGSRFHTMLPQNERDSFPYLLVLVLGSWRRQFILKLYGSIFRLKNSHRKEGLPEVIHLYTSNISFCKFFTCIIRRLLHLLELNDSRPSSLRSLFRDVPFQVPVTATAAEY